MLARTPSTSALKKRRYRRRLRDGVIVLRVDVCEATIAEALLLSGRLSERDALDRGKLTHAVEGLLVEWCARWHRNGS